jgi:predicted nucleic acid-binding Zn ribbon protein
LERETRKPETPGPENLADILGKLFAARGWGRRSARQQLEAAWAEAAGPAIVADARVLAVRRGVLEVEVRTAVLLQELAQFHKRRLLEAVRKRMPGTTVTDLKFRAGAW